MQTKRTKVVTTPCTYPREKILCQGYSSDQLSKICKAEPFAAPPILLHYSGFPQSLCPRLLILKQWLLFLVYMGIRKKLAETTYAAFSSKENTKAEKGYKTTFTMLL